MEEEKATVDAVFDCSEQRKREGAKIHSYLIEYKDIIKPKLFNREIIHDISDLDFNLKNENSILCQLVNKIENLNANEYSKKLINDQLNDTAQKLVKVSNFKDYLESVKSSLDFKKDVIDQTKYDEYKLQIDQTRKSLVELKKTIPTKNMELESIEKDIEKIKDEATKLSLQVQNSDDPILYRPNIVIHDFSYKKNEEIIEKTNLNSLVAFFEIDAERSILGRKTKNFNVTKMLEARIKAKELNETTVNLFIVILDETHKINLKFDEIVPKISHELNVYIICRSSLFNQIKMPENRGTLKFKRETTENYTEWANIVKKEINQQEQTEKRSNNAVAITHLESNQTGGGKNEARQLELTTLQNKRKEIQIELDNMVNAKEYKEQSLKDKEKLLNDLESQRNAVDETIDPRLYQLEAKLNPSIDYLRILCQRRELLLSYIEQIKSFIMNQYSNEGVRTSIPPQIRNMLDFLRLKPFSD